MKKTRLLVLLLLVLPLMVTAGGENSLGTTGYVDIGVTFEGETVAVNPDGDDYKAGSGVLIGGGLRYTLFNETEILHLNEVAVRFQGAKSGKGENRGIVLQSYLLKKWKNVGVGGGLYLDLANQVSDSVGNKTKFNNSLGEFVSVEWVVIPEFSFVLKYVAIDYETTEGVGFDGNHWVLSMRTEY